MPNFDFVIYFLVKGKNCSAKHKVLFDLIALLTRWNHLLTCVSQRTAINLCKEVDMNVYFCLDSNCCP